MEKESLTIDNKKQRETLRAKKKYGCLRKLDRKKKTKEGIKRKNTK